MDQTPQGAPPTAKPTRRSAGAPGTKYDVSRLRGSTGTGGVRFLRFVIPSGGLVLYVGLKAVLNRQTDLIPLFVFLLIILVGYGAGAAHYKRAGAKDLDWYRPSVLIAYHGKPWELFWAALFYSTIGQALTLSFANILDYWYWRSTHVVDSSRSALAYVLSPALMFNYAAFLAGAWGVLNTAVLLQRQRGRFTSMALMKSHIEVFVDEVDLRGRAPASYEEIFLVLRTATVSDLVQASETQWVLDQIRRVAASQHVRLHVVVSSPRQLEEFYGTYYQEDRDKALSAAAKADDAHRHLDVNHAALWYSERITAEQYMVSQSRAVEFAVLPSLGRGNARIVGDSTQDEAWTDFAYGVAAYYLREAITPSWFEDGTLRFPVEQPRVDRIQFAFSQSEAALTRLDADGAMSLEIVELSRAGDTRLLDRPGFSVQLQEIGIALRDAPPYCRVRLVKADREAESPMYSIWSSIVVRPAAQTTLGAALQPSASSIGL